MEIVPKGFVIMVRDKSDVAETRGNEGSRRCKVSLGRRPGNILEEGMPCMPARFRMGSQISF